MIAAGIAGCDDTPQMSINTAGAESSGEEAGESSATGGDAGATAGEVTAGVLGGESSADMMTSGMMSADMMSADMMIADMEVMSLDPVCPESIVLNCDSGTQRFNTAAGQAMINTYTCGDGFNYPGQELLFEFIETDSYPVQIKVTPVEIQNSVSYIVFALEGDPNTCNPSDAPCMARQDSIINEPLRVDYQRGVPLWFTLDPRLIDGPTIEVDVEVLCNFTTCGDGLISEDETCDDGNALSGDGCDASCAVEVGYTCEGTPSVCAPEVIDRMCPNRQEVSSGVYQGDTRACDSTYDTVSGGCGNANGLAGGDQSYLVTIPAGQVLKAQVMSVGASNTSTLWMALDPDDPTETCVQTNGESMYWLNGAETETTVLVVVDEISEGRGGPYQLTLELFDAPPRPGTSCASPIELSESGVYSGDTSGGAQAESNLHGGVGGACIRQGGFWGYNKGPDVIYSVTLQPNQSLTVTSMPTSTWDHVVSIHDDCALFELSCLVWDDFGNGVVTNETDEPRQYYIMVGGFHSYSYGMYDLNITIE
jgi:cysteine-rich repeat protein